MTLFFGWVKLFILYIGDGDGDGGGSRDSMRFAVHHHSDGVNAVN